jgi:hypothetical protein
VPRYRLLVTLIALGSAAATAHADDLLPDLIVNPARLSDRAYVTNIIPGRLHIRLSNATPNIGYGPLFVFAGDPVGGSQAVYQRIFTSEGGFRDRAAGYFLFHPTHRHFHVNDWARYRIRSVLPSDGVGPVLRKGSKTSFCLLDSAKYTGSEVVLGTVPASRQFFSCGDDVQGISVGYEDLYSKDLPDQWIDITGLGPGEYWLESEVDPDNNFEEVDETNNIARIKLVIAQGELPVPDEIPLDRRVPWLLAIVLIFSGAGALALGAGRRGIPKS